MSGFGSFGTGSTGGGMFGAKPPDQQGGGFAIPTTTAVTTSTGITFGTPTFRTGSTSAFGTQQQAPTFGGGFGIKPATTVGPTAFTFGTPATTTAPTFGSVGITNAPTFGPSMGSNFNLTTPKTTATVTPTASIIPPTTTAITTATTSAKTPFSFGASTASATPTTFTMPSTSGAATTTIASTLTFGLPATSISTTTTTLATGFTFTQPSTTTSLNFGVPKTTAGFTFGTTTTSGAPTFNLGSSTTTTSTLTTGLFGTAKTTESLTITTTVGLGGIDNTQTTQGLSGSGTLEPKHVKDHILPDVILQTLNDFQNYTKQQKSISVEISHGSSKPLKKVQEDTEAIESLLMTITSGLTRNAIAVDKLKTETAQGLHQAEMAQRNHESPPGLEYDNSAPSDYFNDLVTKFETDTIRLRVQIEASEKHLKSLTQCSTISPQELTLAMRRLHETLIVLAARVQALHTTVQSQKEQFKNLRRVYFKDDINIFENEPDQARIKKQSIYSLRSLTGPTPFSETPTSGLPLNVDGLAMLASSAAMTSIPTTTTNQNKNFISQ